MRKNLLNWKKDIFYFDERNDKMESTQENGRRFLVEFQPKAFFSRTKYLT